MKSIFKLLLAVFAVCASFVALPGGVLSPPAVSAACLTNVTTSAQADQQQQCIRDYKESCKQAYDDNFCNGLSVEQINQCAQDSATPAFKTNCIKQLQGDFLQGSAATAAGSCSNKGISILPTWYKYIDGTIDSSGHCSLNFTFPDDISAIMLALVEIMLRIAAIVAIGYVIYGAFMYLTTQGEPDRAAAARNTIVNAIIGLVIAIIATGVVSFIGGQLIK